MAAGWGSSQGIHDMSLASLGFPDNQGLACGTMGRPAQRLWRLCSWRLLGFGWDLPFQTHFRPVGSVSAQAEDITNVLLAFPEALFPSGYPASSLFKYGGRAGADAALCYAASMAEHRNGGLAQHPDPSGCVDRLGG
jgi:hypothetical protein